MVAEKTQFIFDVVFIAAQAIQRFDDQRVTRPKQRGLKGLVSRSLQVLARLFISYDITFFGTQGLECRKLAIQVLLFG